MHESPIYPGCSFAQEHVEILPQVPEDVGSIESGEEKITNKNITNEPKCSRSVQKLLCSRGQVNIPRAVREYVPVRIYSCQRICSPV